MGAGVTAKIQDLHTKVPETKEPIFFDLTELFFSSSKFRYYGISRVVAEIAFELHNIEPSVQFVAFSPGHQRFMMLHPSFSTEKTPSALLDLNVPVEARPIHARLVYYKIPTVFRFVLQLRARLIRQLNRRRWNASRLVFEEARLQGATLVSMGRPKLMAEFMASLDTIQGLRFIALLHDVIPLSTNGKSGSQSFFSNFLHDNNAVIGAATGVLANSFFTREELIRFSKNGILNPLPHVDVLQLAHECRESSEPINQAIPTKPYLLCVGSTLGRKNLDVVLDALGILKKKQGRCPTLVLAGTIRRRVKKTLITGRYQGLCNDVLFVANPNQAELVRLYKGCLVLILPSFIEGWGLPAGEALWLGRPALCSDIPVLREVCGDRGLYFNPHDPQALADHISELTANPGKEPKEGENLPALRSWAMVAKELLDIVSKKPSDPTSSPI